MHGVYKCTLTKKVNSNTNWWQSKQSVLWFYFYYIRTSVVCPLDFTGICRLPLPNVLILTIHSLFSSIVQKAQPVRLQIYHFNKSSLSLIRITQYILQENFSVMNAWVTYCSVNRIPIFTSYLAKIITKTCHKTQNY